MPLPIVVQILAGLAGMKILDFAVPTRESVLEKKRQTLARRQQSSTEGAKNLLAARERGEQHADALNPTVDIEGISRLMEAIGDSSSFGRSSDDGTGMSVEDGPPLRATSEGTSAVGAVDSGDLDVEGMMSAIASLTDINTGSRIQGSGLLSRLADIRNSNA